MDARVENLNSGNLLKLLQEMNDDEKKENNEDGKPVLLQIRSIIPVSAESDLWPERGFYLKVSDSSHSMYVSLTHQQDEMVLCNELQLGQLILVEKLKPAYPVPVLKGVVPVPGRHPCNGDLQDLDFINGVADLEAVLNSASKVDAKSSEEEKSMQNFRPSSASKVHPIENIGRCSRISDVNNGFQALSSTSTVDKYCDSDMLGTSMSLPAPRRKSWNTREILDSMHVIKHGWKPTGRSRSACTSPIRASKYERSPELSRSKTRVKDNGRSMNIYSEIQSSKMPCQQLSVDKFFNLQDNLTQTLMIFQSLKSISPLKENDDNDNKSKSSISEAMKLASERKRNATSWINLALESDLSSLPWDSRSVSKQANDTTLSTFKKSNVNSTSHIPKGMYLVKMQRGCGDEQLGLAADHSPPEWERGSSIGAASELANSLRDDCAKWFLEHAEKYLDEADTKAATRSDCEVAEIMRQIKKVNDWLDNLNKRKDGAEDDEMETHGRLRNKIYSILLKNLERTAVALEGTNIPS